jgi:hypothetical protein
MQFILLITISTFGLTDSSLKVATRFNGFLTINTDQPGISVYLDGDLIGVTPITNYSLEAGEYTVSLYDSRSIENEYWNLRKSGPCRKLKALWQLIRIDAATQKVKIIPNQNTKLTFYLRRIDRTPVLAKCLFSGSVIGIFGLGVLTGVLIAK